MTVRDDFTVDWTKSPRIITIAAPSTEITMQDLVDTIRTIEERLENIDEDALLSAAGKEDLGGGVRVGITATLQNAKIAFESRTSSVSEGTATTADADGEILIDSSATFQTDGIEAGDTIINITDKSIATVVSVESQTEIKHLPLADGTENDWDIGDVYKIWPVIQCEASGGNLVAVDIVGSGISSLHPTAFTQIVRTSSASATLQELKAIQFSSYQNGVWVSPSNGQSGTGYPIGTREYPVDNFDDTLTIAVERGLNTFYPLENVTCSGHNINGLRIIGENPILTTVTLLEGCSTEGTEFNNCTLTGTINGKIEIRDCIINTISGFKGTAYDCSLTGKITLGGTSSDMAQFLGCYLGTAYIGLVEIDMNGDGPHLSMRAFAGGLKISNKSGDSKVAIDFISGRIEIANTVTAGTFYIRGVGEITENLGTGITLYDAPLINPTAVSDQVWDELVSEHLSTDTFGEYIDFISKIEGGRWKIVDNQMIFYAPDNVAEIARFNLYDADGQPAIEGIMERTRV